MPYNKGYEEGDAEAQASQPQRNDPSHNSRVNATTAPDESTLLQEMDTYFSEEKILIPETEKASRTINYHPLPISGT